MLTLLSRGGAVLAAAEGMEMAVVVREGQEADGHKVAVSRPLAGALALTGWIACSRRGRISRYSITAGGRTALNRIIADQENRARVRLEGGFAAAQVHRLGRRTRAEAGGLGRKSRYSGAETPLEMLSRLSGQGRQVLPYSANGAGRAAVARGFRAGPDQQPSGAGGAVFRAGHPPDAQHQPPGGG